jgi:hypothetical protein
MNRRALGFLAILIIVLMAIVAMAGLDNLPRQLRSRAEGASTQIQSDRKHFESNRAAVERALTTEPDLFRTQTAPWRDEIRKAQAQLGEAEITVTSLRGLAEANRRQDRQTVERDLAKLDSLRGSAVLATDRIRRQAERWIEYKRDLPHQLETMRTNYEHVHTWDVAAATAPAQKAMTDWPGKKDDLQHRTDALSALKQQGEAAWVSTSEARAKAESQDWAAVDYAALFSGGEQLQSTLKQLSDGTSAMNTLAPQPYVDRNKLLLDLADGPRQKVRVIETKFSNSSLKDGQTTYRERWETIDEARFHELAQNVGTVVERKPAGKYDSEAELTPQAPAYAYIAQPGQLNAYGRWSNGVWEWLPQYLLFSQLLMRSAHPPITSGDFYAYESARRRGESWYGRSGEYRRPSSSEWWSRRGSAARRALDSLARSSGGSGWYRERPRTSESPSWGSGSYSGSRYQSRGSFSGSRYQSRGGYRSFGSRSYSRSFSRGRR